MKLGRGMGLFEFAVVMAIVGLLLVLLLQRLAESASSARRVQLQMAAEALRLNANLIQLRCGQGFDADCWRRLLAQRRQASVREASGAAPFQDEPKANAFGLLRSVALASGLEQGWDWQQPDAQRLQLAPQGVAHCRLELLWTPTQAVVQVRTLEDRC